MLCTNGQIENYQPGPICVEGEPATCFYVLIDGELTMSKLSGGQDIETNRTSQRGVYCGAWRAFTGGKQKSYDASVHVTKPSRFFVMDAPVFATVHAATSSRWRSTCSTASPSAPTGPAGSSTTGRSCWRWAGCRPG